MGCVRWVLKNPLRLTFMVQDVTKSNHRPVKLIGLENKAGPLLTLLYFDNNLSG